MKFEITIFSAIFALLAVTSLAEEIDAETFIAAHNKWRSEAGITDKLSYSPALAANAQAWADNLKRTNHCQMRHSQPNGRYGENLYWASALTWTDGRKERTKVSSKQVVDAWASEKANYDYSSNRCAAGKVCGHYTQVVWRNTSAVGCGVAVCQDSQEQVWVCQYQPAGNWLGSKPY